jgi:hypothetical protein
MGPMSQTAAPPPSLAHEPVTARAAIASRARTWLGVPALLGAGLVLWDPARNGGPPLCPYRLVTGHTCPGCGLTRAIGALLRGRWNESVTLHPLAPVVLAVVVAGCVAYVLLGDRFRRAAQSPAGAGVAGLLGIALLATWVLRVRSGQIDVLG